MYVFIYIELWVCGFMVECMCAIVLILGCAFIVVLMMYIGLCLCIMHCWIYTDYCVCFRLYVCILHLYICCVLHGNYLCILIIISVYFCVFMGNMHMVYGCMLVCLCSFDTYISVYFCILVYPNISILYAGMVVSAKCDYVYLHSHTYKVVTLCVCVQLYLCLPVYL